MGHSYILTKTSTSRGFGSIDYLDETYRNRLADDSVVTEKQIGQVYVSGFLREMIIMRGELSQGAMDNEERKKKISAAIRKHHRRFGTWRGAYAHKLVLSMSDEMNERIRNAGLNPDKILIQHIKKVMRNFQNHFYRDRIGYAYGIFHNTNNLHVKIYLLNRTENGKHVGFSNPLKGKYDSKPRNNHIGFCKERLVEIAENFIKKLDAGE